MKIRAVVLEEKTIIHKSKGSKQKAEGRELFRPLIRVMFLLSAYCLLLTVIRLPGLVAGSPRLQASQSADAIAGTSIIASENRGTPTSAFPPERSIIEAAATIVASDNLNASIVWRVESPVVITSSITRMRSPLRTVKPRRKVILPLARSVQMKRAPRCLATS